jgi:hypothetical protein
VRPPVRTQGGALPGLAVLLLGQVALQLAMFAYQVNQQGPTYVKYALGFGDQPRFAGCGVFTVWDTAQCVAMIVMAVAGFTRRAWIRPAATVLMLTSAYALGTSLINVFTSDNGWADMTQNSTDTLLTLDMIAQVVIGLVLPIVVLATRPNGINGAGGAGLPPGYQPLAGMAPGPQPGYAPPMPPAPPVPPQDAFRGDAPGFPPPPAQPPGQPGQQPYGGGYPPNR